MTQYSRSQFDRELNTRSPTIRPGMFSYFITFDDEFNMKEYDVAQPGLIISIKLSRWHYSAKSYLLVCVQEVVGPSDEEPHSHFPGRPLLLLLPLLPRHIHRCSRNPRPPQVPCLHTSSFFHIHPPQLQHPQCVSAQRRDPSQHPQAWLSHHPRHLDLWLLPCHLPHQVHIYHQKIQIL